jgi:signal transduction histidine kinase
LVELLASHPVYIIALSIIAQLQMRLHMAREEAFRNKERFLAMLSHEIRNLLQTMMGSIDLLDVRAKDPVQRQAISHLLKATTQLQAYLNDITEFTRLEDPSMQVETRPFDMVRMLEELREEWLPETESKGLYLHLQIDEASRPKLMSVTSDEARLRQIVSNLISNSTKYTPTGGVTLSAGVSDESPDRVRLEVADTGTGIEEQFLEKIFQPYARLENAKRQTAEGSGLGLLWWIGWWSDWAGSFGSPAS